MVETIIFGLAAGLLATNPATAGPETLGFEAVAREFTQHAWRHEHGLPNNRVWAITQTRDGALWVATQGGLARFDGTRFTVYNQLNTPELANTECRGLVEDSEGNLWISVRNGLVRKTGDVFTHFGGPQGATALEYPVLGARQAGGVWASGNRTLDLVAGTVTNLVPSKWPLTKLDARVMADVRGVLWVGTPRGLFRFHPGHTGEIATGPEIDFTAMTAGALWSDQDGTMWVLFSAFGDAPPSMSAGFSLAEFRDGRWVRPPNPGQWDFVGDNRVIFLAKDRFGALWMPSHSNQLYRYAKGRFQQLPLLRTDEDVHALCVFSDREGSLWIGTAGQGLLQWTPRTIDTYTTSDGLPHDNAWTLAEGRDGRIWIGTDGGLSVCAEGRITNVTRGDGSPIKDIRAVAEDSRGRVWAGTMRSLERVESNQLTTVSFPGEWEEAKVRALYPGRDGALWIGTVRGLNRLEGGQLTKFTRADGLGADEVRAILEDRRGDLWVGTLGGGLSRRRDGVWSTWTTTNGLPNNNVWALFEDTDGVLWGGTENGLFRFVEGRATRYTTAQGLPDNEINSILEDDFGRLWITHDRGIYWVRKQELNAVASGAKTSVSAVSYDDSDGLITEEFNGQKSNPAGCKTRDGRLWFPTVKGVAVVDPRKAVLDDPPPVPLIEEMRANGKVVAHRSASGSNPAGGILRLPPGSARTLQFRFGANTFAAPEKTRFRYRLAGLADHWEDAPGREVHFADLRPGDYEFEVIAANHRGVWQTQGARVAFQLVPFYYQTVWFAVACGTAAVGLLALVLAWRVREVRRIHRLEQRAALEEQRRQIARDIHDELGASLTQILQLSAQDLESARGGGAGTNARRIAAVAEAAVDHIGEIVWTNNPEYDTLEDLVAYLREYAATFLGAAEIQARFDFPKVVPVWRVPGRFRRHVLLVVKEALQNATKHSGAGEVRLALKVEGSWLDLMIRDNGRGLGGGSGSSGNGLANMQQRAAELGGTFEMESAPDRGVEIRLRVPIPSS